jgi:hypothetical protein
VRSKLVEAVGAGKKPAIIARGLELDDPSSVDLCRVELHET